MMMMLMLMLMILLLLSLRGNLIACVGFGFCVMVKNNKVVNGKEAVSRVKYVT